MKDEGSIPSDTTLSGLGPPSWLCGSSFEWGESRPWRSIRCLRGGLAGVSKRGVKLTVVVCEDPNSSRSRCRRLPTVSRGRAPCVLFPSLYASRHSYIHAYRLHCLCQTRCDPHLYRKPCRRQRACQTRRAQSTSGHHRHHPHRHPAPIVEVLYRAVPLWGQTGVACASENPWCWY